MKCLNKREFDYTNITKWHEKGILGQGVTIASFEDDKGHGAFVADILRQIAPKARVLTKRLPGGRSSNGRFIDGAYKKHEEYFKSLVEEGVSVVTMSLGGSANKDLEYLMNKYLTKNDIICFKSAGNMGGRGESAGNSLDAWLPVAAVQFLYNNKKPVRVSYSSIGENVFISGFTSLDTTLGVNFNGTSCASPFVAGMIALYHCWYLKSFGKIPKYLSSINFIVDNAEDLGAKGRDPEYGYGILRLPIDLIMEEVNVPIIKPPTVKPPINKTKTINLYIGTTDVEIDGVKSKIDIAPFVNLDSRTLVPIRFISEELGAMVDWNSSSQQVTIYDKGIEIKMWIGKNEVSVNGNIVSIDTAPVLERGRTFVPIRTLAEILNYDVEWIGSEQKVVIRR